MSKTTGTGVPLVAESVTHREARDTETTPVA